MIIQTDASLTWWGALCNRVQISGKWLEEERTIHINVLELLVIKLGLFFSHQREKSESHTLSDRQPGNLVLSFENRGKKERTHIRLSKDICHYILNGIVFMTVEHLSSVLNKVLDSKSRKKTDFSKWHPKVTATGLEPSTT